jgi:hypothetical protein
VPVNVDLDYCNSLIRPYFFDDPLLDLARGEAAASCWGVLSTSKFHLYSNIAKFRSSLSFPDQVFDNLCQSNRNFLMIFRCIEQPS